MHIRGICTLVNPPVKTGPRDGRFQPEPGTKSKKRGLLKGPIKTGPEGGKFQTYRGKKGKTKRRYLLHKKKKR